jgi:hypothetical protein
MVCEVAVVVSLLAEATVTRYPREGVGDGAVQVTSTVAAPVCSAAKSVTAAEPTLIKPFKHILNPHGGLLKQVMSQQLCVRFKGVL